jgi:hypothetical protein
MLSMKVEVQYHPGRGIVPGRFSLINGRGLNKEYEHSSGGLNRLTNDVMHELIVLQNAANEMDSHETDYAEAVREGRAKATNRQDYYTVEWRPEDVEARLRF